MICKGCDNNYDDSYQFCPYCGRAKSQHTKVAVETRESETLQTCPVCHRDDRSIITRSYLAVQIEKLTANMTAKPNPLFMEVFEGIGEKPKGCLKSIFDSNFKRKLAAWDDANRRFMTEVYYCERCDEFFFTDEGQKIHGRLSEVTLFLYSSYHNPVTNRIHLPRKIESEIRQLVASKQSQVARERVQQIIGDMDGNLSYAISSYIDSCR